MPRRSDVVPAYLHHKPTGQAYVRIRTPGGGRKDVYLGLYGTPASKVEYEKILAELRSSPVVLSRPAGVTVNELLLAFVTYADSHYRGPAGELTRELTEYRQAAKLLRGLYGHVPAKDFGPLALKAVRERMVADGIARKVVNLRVGRVKRIFKWAASEELIPASVVTALGTVAGLRQGRAGVRDTDPVLPADPGDVRATLPHVRPEVAAMAEVQLLTGMRPGEVCRMRPVDVDRSGPVWVYAPPRHKGTWRGKARTVAIGPKAQAVLSKFWPADPAEYVFSPKRAVEALHAARTAARKTPKYPSAANRVQRVAVPKRKPAERYAPSSYGHAVAKGCKKAHVPHWHPNQLRHTHATEVRRLYGLEAAGAALGHSKLSATGVYAEKDAGLALRVAAEIG